ncbi:MAG: hypothetical protein K1X67_14890, partial [Fimbriimonadaceae bacterium]|nr:hypothetical protein [Fimbriimonadaceae bacterium]
TPAVRADQPLPQPLSSATSHEAIENLQGAGEGSRADESPAVRGMITGMLVGHDPIPFFSRFAECIDEVHVVPIDFHRSRDPFELAKEIEPLFPRVTAHATVQEAMKAVAGTEAVLVTGSFYLVGEIGNLLGPWTGKT